MQFNKFIVREPVGISRWEARMAIRDRVKPAILMGFLFIIMMNIPGNIILAFSGAAANMLNPWEALNQYATAGTAGTAQGVAYNALGGMMSAMGGYLLYALLVSGAVCLSQALFFLRYKRRQVAETELIFYGFRYFGKALGTFLLICVFTAAWVVLAYLPGSILGSIIIVMMPNGGGLAIGVMVIMLALAGAAALGTIKALQYSLAYFIMADHPDIGPLESIRISKFLMFGNRGKFFLLNLSFIGWYILAYIASNIAATPFSLILQSAGISATIGGQLAFMIISSVISGLCFGFLNFYRGTATAAFYEKVRGLAPGGILPQVPLPPSPPSPSP